MSTKESVLFINYATMLTLLDMGLTYTEIKNLSNTEIVMFSAMYASIQDFKNEQIERNAKHQQTANAHPTFPRRF